MQIYSLASGSKGNCTLICTEKHNILIDVGLSMKKINEALLMSEGLTLDDVDIVLLSHSHIDHIQAVKTIYNKYKHIQFISNKITYDECNEVHKVIMDKDRFNFNSSESFVDMYGNELMFIESFPLNHDKECQGYMITSNSESYVHIADNGKLWDKDIIEHLHNKKYYSIESNHDRTLQINDMKRHEGLKRRVLGAYGHTNNVDAMELAFKLIGDKTRSIVFNHLSDECNSLELASTTHNNLISIWGKKTEFKNIKIQYAEQERIIKL